VCAGRKRQIAYKGKPKIHIVAEGETIEQIARVYVTTPEAIVDRNCVDRECVQQNRLVVAGQRLVIPIDHYTVGLFWL
jgi:spore germination protein YaaH